MTLTSRSNKQLFVEGTNDKFFTISITKRMRSTYVGDARLWFGGFHIESSGSDSQALDDFKLASKGTKDQVYGIILDADDLTGKHLADRWKDISSIPTLKGANPPATIPPTGWIGQIPDGPKVGAWIFPDNIGDGALEAFIASFIPASSLWTFSEKVVKLAKKNHGASFADIHKVKARIHSWLSWCKEPGRPYGRAMECGDLDVNQNPVGGVFVNWLEALFT
jgi:hypothetical protein